MFAYDFSYIMNRVGSTTTNAAAAYNLKHSTSSTPTTKQKTGVEAVR
jgi:hypothetical protein